MTHQPIILQKIDFSQPDGEFVFKGQVYELKKYLNNYFFRNKKHVNHDFICLLDYFNYSKLVKDIFQNKATSQAIEQTIQEKYYYIQRCVQYKEALFGFGTNWNRYHSPESNEWLSLKEIGCKVHKNLSIEELLEKPYKSFIEQAISLYEKEIPLIKDDDLFYSVIIDEDRTIEFLCGSEKELERLTKLAIFALPELSHLFERNSSIMLIYESNNDYRSGGILKEIEVENWRDITTLSNQAQRLLNLIFEYNFFTGLHWEYNDGDPGYTGYDPSSYRIEVEVQAPSQHERLEAAMELQSWLEGKLPEEEIKSYFE